MENIYNNKVTNSGLLTATGAETVYDTTVIIEFSIDGIAYRKAAVTDGATPTTDGVTAAAFDAVTPDKACIFAWCLNASGTVSLIQSEIVEVDGVTDLLEQPIQFPNIPSDRVAFAYTLYQTDGTSSASGLRPGTDNWNATGLTVTHRNLMDQPSRPVAS